MSQFSVNTKHLVVLAALTTAAHTASAGTFFGFRFNFGGPVYAAPVTYSAPPVAVAPEQAVPPPGPGYVFIAGHWTWTARGWAWANGHWELPPQANAVWQAGHWLQQGNGWMWVDGTWVVPAPPPPPPAPLPAPAAVATPTPAPEIYVTQAPPVSEVEAIPVSPGADYVWIGGSWAWRGSWVWTSGYYAHRPVGRVAWVPGYWGHRGSGWVWVGGRWR